MYSDSVELSLVSDTHPPFFEFLPIQKKNLAIRHTCRLIRSTTSDCENKLINTITIKLCDNTDEAFSIEEGKVFCWPIFVALECSINRK